MAFSNALAILSGLIGLIGIIFRQNVLVGLAVLLLFFGFALPLGALSIPWYVWAVVVLVGIIYFTKK